MNPDQITLKGAVHIVFNIGYKKLGSNVSESKNML